MKSSSSSTFFEGAEAPQETIQPIRLPNRFSFRKISKGSTKDAQKAQTPTSCIDSASVPKTRCPKAVYTTNNCPTKQQAIATTNALFAKTGNREVPTNATSLRHVRALTISYSTKVVKVIVVSCLVLESIPSLANSDEKT